MCYYAGRDFVEHVAAHAMTEYMSVWVGLIIIVLKCCHNVLYSNQKRTEPNL